MSHACSRPWVRATGPRSTACIGRFTRSCAAWRRPTCGGNAPGTHCSPPRSSTRPICGSRPIAPTGKDRRHFFGAAAEAMRRILVDHARQRRADKRGAGVRAGHADRSGLTVGCRRKTWTSCRSTAALEQLSAEATAAGRPGEPAILRRACPSRKRRRRWRSRRRPSSATGPSHAPGSTSASALSGSAHEPGCANRQLFEACVESPADAEREDCARSVRRPRAARQVRELLRAHADGVGVDAAGGTRSRSFPRLARRTRSVHYRIRRAYRRRRDGRGLSRRAAGAGRRRVALKLIKLGLDTREVIARFELERQTLAMMDHPNIARIFDAGTTEDGRPYFAMEYVPGVPITRYCGSTAALDRATTRAVRAGLRRRPARAPARHHPSRPQALELLVAEIDGRPVPKIIDFGIAKAIDSR